MLNILSAKALVLLAAAAFFSAAQSSERAVPEVTILAEKQDHLADGVVHAEGGVSLTSQDIRIDADEIDFAPASAGGPRLEPTVTSFCVVTVTCSDAPNFAWSSRLGEVSFD